MKKIILLVLLGSTFSAHAQIYKCALQEGKIVYQAMPCPSTAAQSIVEIKDISPERLEQAQQELKRFEKEEQEQELADEAAEKERQKVLREQAIINALNRSAAAEEQRARAEENRSRYEPMYPQIISPGFIRLPGFNPQMNPGAGRGHSHEPNIKYETVPPVTPPPGKR